MTIVRVEDDDADDDRSWMDDGQRMIVTTESHYHIKSQPHSVTLIDLKSERIDWLE